MKRLTERFSNGQAAVAGYGSQCQHGFIYYENIPDENIYSREWSLCPTIDEILEKLAEYEDAEEHGLLLRLPCKVGDEFWELNTVNGIPHIYPRIAHSLSHCVYVLERLGKTAFLTKEEAEQALAKMEEV